MLIYAILIIKKRDAKLVFAIRVFVLMDNAYVIHQMKFLNVLFLKLKELDVAAKYDLLFFIVK